jgi:hypothetical protein
VDVADGNDARGGLLKLARAVQAAGPYVELERRRAGAGEGEVKLLRRSGGESMPIGRYESVGFERRAQEPCHPEVLRRVRPVY